MPLPYENIVPVDRPLPTSPYSTPPAPLSLDAIAPAEKQRLQAEALEEMLLRLRGQPPITNQAVPRLRPRLGQIPGLPTPAPIAVAAGPNATVVAKGDPSILSKFSKAMPLSGIGLAKKAGVLKFLGGGLVGGLMLRAKKKKKAKAKAAAAAAAGD